MRAARRPQTPASSARAVTAAACAASLVMLSACGGGGSGDAGTTTAAATTTADTSTSAAATTADSASTTASTTTTTSAASAATSTSATTSSSSGAIDPTNLAGTAHLTFDDEFDGLSLWNGASGTWDTTFYYDDSNVGSTLSGNGEQQMYINANYAGASSVKPWTVSSGVVSLTAAKASSSISSLINGYSYTSGMLNSYHSFSQTYGYFEISAKLPAGQGFWPAFWLMPTNGSWPPELDVMEVLGKDPTTLYTTVHYNSDNEMETQNVAVADMSAGFHTYGVDWEADYITWYFDHKQVYRVATPAGLNTPMYLILNLARGGDVDQTTPLPGSYQIDYVRVYAAGT